MKINKEDLNASIYFYDLKQDTKSIATGNLIIID